MIKSIAQLGIDYKVKDPFKNYGTLVAKCLKAAKSYKHPVYTKDWSVWIKPEDITILPQFIDILKTTSYEGLEFKNDSNLNKSPNEIRERTDLIVTTTAQFLDQYARGENVLRDVNWQWIDFAWEDIGGRVPRGYFYRGIQRPSLGGNTPDRRDGDCAVRSAVRGNILPSSSLSDSPLIFNPTQVTHIILVTKDGIHKKYKITEEK